MKRSFTHAEGSARRAIAVASAITAVLGAGCAGSGAGGRDVATGPPRPPPATAETPPALVDSAQRDAQRAWCAYLDALYKKAAGEGVAWSKLEQCRGAVSTASPAMLKRAADCSLRALQGFSGDPFGPEYAAIVSHCGQDAIDAEAIPRAAVMPYLDIICKRAATCGQLGLEECRATISDAVGPLLSRAIGAINEPSRGRLRSCLEAVSCNDLGEQISGCVAPILDDLIWLPP